LFDNVISDLSLPDIICENIKW